MVLGCLPIVRPILSITLIRSNIVVVSTSMCLLLVPGRGVLASRVVMYQSSERVMEPLSRHKMVVMLLDMLQSVVDGVIVCTPRDYQLLVVMCTQDSVNTCIDLLTRHVSLLTFSLLILCGAKKNEEEKG
jgi:hypothetical protein